MPPSISIREYIRWLPEQPSEPTTTLVLTSAQNRFVDIRILNPVQGKRSEEGVRDVLPMSRLDWAFAGTSSSTLKTGPSGEQTVHSKWSHWVDSRFADAESVVDEGVMEPNAGGDVGLTVEKGRMVNPATGRMTEYEEGWRDVEPIVTSTDSDVGASPTVAVLSLHDDDRKARGMVVRVGQFCQGLLRVDDLVTLERWAWETGEGKAWKRQVRVGSLFVPCGTVLQGVERLEVGGEVKFGEFVWTVVELS